MRKLFVAIFLDYKNADNLKKEICLQEDSGVVTKIDECVEIFKVLVAEEQFLDFKGKLGNSIIGEEIYSSGDILIERNNKEEWCFKSFDFELTGEKVKLLCILENKNGEKITKYKEDLILKKKNETL